MKRTLLGIIALTMAGSPAAATARLPAKFEDKSLNQEAKSPATQTACPATSQAQERP